LNRSSNILNSPTYTCDTIILCVNKIVLVMKIKSIEIENFKGIKKGNIDCIQYNGFVGPNGSGKSTVLDALNIFFNERTKFSDDDFYNRKTDETILIKLIFNNLSEVAVADFSHYVRNEELVVSVVLQKSPENKFIKTVRGERLIFEPFKSFFENSGGASERKVIFDSLREEYPEIPTATTDGNRKQNLIDYEEQLGEDLKVLTPSGEDFFGVSSGAHLIRKHVHWVYVPAVKDASTESEEGKTSFLGKLIQQTIKSEMDYESSLEDIKNTAFASYETLLNDQKQHLESLESRLSERLEASVTTEAKLDLEWKKDERSVSVADPIAKVNLTDKGFTGEVESFGHGLQRAFLIVVLQELVSVDTEVTPTLLLGIEEPELYQHPPQAKHLASILMELSEGDTQIFLSTHSPYFINIEFFEGIKMFRNTSGQTKITCSNLDEIITKYNTAFAKGLMDEDQARTKLSVNLLPKYNELFFTDKVVLVEGISDQACLEAYLKLSGSKKDFMSSGISILVCEGKSSLSLMVLIAKSFEIPTHVIFDCDSDCEAHHQADHVRDNNAIFQLVNGSTQDQFPSSHVLEKNMTAWVNNIDEVLNDQLDAQKDVICNKGRAAAGNLRNCGKNPIYIAAVFDEAFGLGKDFPVFKQVVENILEE